MSSGGKRSPGAIDGIVRAMWMQDEEGPDIQW